MCGKVTLGRKELIFCSVCPSYSTKHHPNSPFGAGMGFSLYLLLALLGATGTTNPSGHVFPTNPVLWLCPQ